MKTFELKLQGKDLVPSELSVHELTDLLLAIERAVVKTALHSQQGLDEDETYIALVGVAEGSTTLRFTSALPATSNAFLQIGNALSSRSYSELPSPAIEALREISDYSEEREAIIGFYSSDNSHPHLLAEIRPDVDLKLPLVDVVHGTTTVYGKLTRVGGNPPKARITLLNGEAISCFVSEKLAKRIGNRLYEVIGLSGDAKWDADDYALLSFKAHDIAPYEETTLQQAVKELKESAGSAWQNVKDVNAFIDELRRD
jgi:hypothetical protein